jgi:hypothetical protein
MSNTARIAAIRAQLAALADELDDLQADETNHDDDQKPKPDGRAEGLAEARRRFPKRTAETSSGEDTDDDQLDDDRPDHDSTSAHGAAEARRRFG